MITKKSIYMYIVIVHAYAYVQGRSHKNLSDQVHAIPSGRGTNNVHMRRGPASPGNFGFLDILRTFLVYLEGKIEV